MTELEWLKWAFIAVLSGFTYMMKRELNTKDEELKQIRDDIQNLKDSRVHKDELREFKTDLKGWFDELKQDIRALRNENKA